MASGDASATQVLMPVGDGQLRGDDGGAGAVAFLDGLEQILLFAVGEAGKTEVVHDQDR